MMFMTEPQPSDGFEWVQAPWGSVLRCRPLLTVAPHFFTAASLRLREDATEWEKVAQFAGVPADRVRLLRQVHGHTVTTSRAGTSQPWGTPEADGVISNDPSAALAVRVADCAPILMADRRRGVAAAVHAGWRSTLQRVVADAVAGLGREFDTNPADLIVAIGPCLGACCGEMGEEVVAAFREAGHGEDRIDRWFSRVPGRRSHFDLWRANTDQLQDAGVPPESIHVSGLCTRTHDSIFHSYRARGSDAGRMVGIIRARG
jgi:YfiH family protein